MEAGTTSAERRSPAADSGEKKMCAPEYDREVLSMTSAPLSTPRHHAAVAAAAAAADAE